MKIHYGNKHGGERLHLRALSILHQDGIPTVIRTPRRDAVSEAEARAPVDGAAGPLRHAGALP
jgi:hypothetical protein